MVGIVKALLAGIAIVCAAMPAAAKVVKADINGFVVAESGDVQASPEAVWGALTHPERWWNKAHSWTGDARQGPAMADRLLSYRDWGQGAAGVRADGL